MSRSRKIILLILSFACIYSSFIIHHSSFARADYQSAYRDYSYNYQLYKGAENQFLIARSSYQTYRTLTSQNDAIAKFRQVLKARDQVLASYYNLLQEKLNNTDGVGGDNKDTFNKIRASENTWLGDHQKKIDAAASLDDLNSVSSEFETRFLQMDTETKQAIGTVLSAKETTLRARVNSEIDQLNDRLSQIRGSGDDTSIADRGVINVKNKLDLFSQKLDESGQVFSGSNNYSNQGIDLFAGESKLTEANQYLREATSFLLEIVKSFTG